MYTFEDDENWRRKKKARLMPSSLPTRICVFFFSLYPVLFAILFVLFFIIFTLNSLFLYFFFWRTSLLSSIGVLISFYLTFEAIEFFTLAPVWSTRQGENCRTEFPCKEIENDFNRTGNAHWCDDLLTPFFFFFIFFRFWRLTIKTTTTWIPFENSI